jgi:hypothetical protein
MARSGYTTELWQVESGVASGEDPWFGEKVFFDVAASDDELTADESIFENLRSSLPRWIVTTVQGPLSDDCVGLIAIPCS